MSETYSFTFVFVFEIIRWALYIVTTGEVLGAYLQRER